MNRELRKELNDYFKVPPPEKKAAFLEGFPQPQISTGSFIFSQIPYIKKGIWPLSALIFLPALWGAYFADPNTIWIVSSFIPFLSLALVTESTKSVVYKMDELEQAARFSLKSVLLARLIILGTFNLIIMCFLIPVCHASSALPLIQTGVYLFTPYLLTTTVCLWTARHFRNKEVLYACMFVTILVSSGNAGIRLFASVLHETHYFIYWALLAVLLTGMAGTEIYKMIQRSEEHSWSLSLTD